MATLTREQAIKWSNQASNGFNLDVESYVMWSEKELTKKIKLDNGGNVIEYKFWRRYPRPSGARCTDFAVGKAAKFARQTFDPAPREALSAEVRRAYSAAKERRPSTRVFFLWLV